MSQFVAVGVRSFRFRRMLPSLFLPALAVLLLPAAARAQVTFTGALTTVPTSGLTNPTGVAVDAAGDVFIADAATNLVVEAPWTGSAWGTQITVPASGLNQPAGVALDAAGDVFIADGGNNRVVEVPWTGSSWGTQITVPATGLNGPGGVALDAAGDLFIADTANSRVVEVPWTGSSWGTQTTVPTSGLSAPAGVALDAAGDLFIADFANGFVVEVPRTGSSWGTQTTVPTSGLANPVGVAVDAAGDLFIADSGSIVVVEVPWTGSSWGAQTTVPFSGLEYPQGVAVDGKDNVYVSDAAAGAVYMVSPSPSVNFGSQDVGSASAVPMNFTIASSASTTVGGIAFLTTGIQGKDFADAGSRTCTSQTYATATSCVVNVNFKPLAPGLRRGAVAFYDGSFKVLATVLIYGVATGPQTSYQPATKSTLGSGFALPGGVAVDANSNVFVADDYNHAVKEILAAGGYTTVKTLGSGFRTRLAWP